MSDSEAPKGPGKEAPLADQENAAKAQSAAGRVQIEDLLDFSFTEVLLERRVILNGSRFGLSCS